MKKLLVLLIILLLSFSLCSCDLLCACEKDIDFPEDNFNIPEDNSLVTYNFSNGDILTLLYSNKDSVNSKYRHGDAYLFYGEWQRENKTMKVCVSIQDVLDTCWQHGRNIVGFKLIVFEITGTYVLEKNRIEFDVPDGFAMNYNTRSAEFDAGILNSTKLTLHPSGEELSIVNISVEKSSFTYWDWNDPTWADFDTYGENTRFVADEIELSYHPWRNMGEMKIGEEKHPIKLVFHEEAMTISVYDMSNNGSAFIMNLLGHMDAENTNKFIVDKFECSRDFKFADDFSNLSDVQIIKTESIDK